MNIKKLNLKNIVSLNLLLVSLFTSSAIFPTKAHAFRFVTWGDSRDNPSILSQQSTQVKGLSPQPSFTLFNGDLCGSWSTTCIQAWQGYLNGGNNNGIGIITFPVRGNHDSGSGTAWSTFFNQSGTAARVGATNYTALTADMTYSFDYQGAHFVGIDLPGGDISSMNSAQITWLDSDLRASESRGNAMAFLYWHGAPYYVDDHASTAPSALVNVLNNHQSVTAIYNGHEHVIAHVTLDRSRLAGLTSHTIEEFVDGTSGAPHYSCASGRSDFCQAVDAFAVTDVLSSSQYTVTIYKLNSNTPLYQRTFTKLAPSIPTPTPLVTLNPTIVPTPLRTSTPLPTRSPSPTPISTTPIATQTPIATGNTTGGNFQPSAPYYATFFYNWFKSLTVDRSWGIWSDPDALGSHSPPANWFSNYLPEPSGSFLPGTGLYSSNDYNNFKWQLSKLKEAKQEVAIASWWGQGDRSDIAFSHDVTDFMNRVDNPYPNLRWAFYYECEAGPCNGTTNPSVSQITSDLNYLGDKYASEPSMLKINGKPVMFVYADSSDAGTTDASCSDGSMAARWNKANQQATTHFYLVLKVFPGYLSSACQPDSWHQYSPAVREDQQGSYSFAVSPGFWRSGDVVRLGRDLVSFTTSVRHMVASNTAWKLTTTWNEWGEGTSVEPGVAVHQINGSTAATEDLTAPIFGNSYVEALGANLPPLESQSVSPTPIVTINPTSSPKVGDANGDGVVNNSDYLIWGTYFGQVQTGSRFGDFNNDSKVDGVDYTLWVINYGK